MPHRFKVTYPISGVVLSWNGLGPLPLRWFLTHQEKNHGPPQAAHIATSGLLQPWPGITDSPKWFHPRRHIYTPCIAFQRCPQEIMSGELYKFFLMNMNFYHYTFIHYIFFPTKEHNIFADVLILLWDFILILTNFVLELE